MDTRGWFRPIVRVRHMPVNWAALQLEQRAATVRWETLQGSGKVTRPGPYFTGGPLVAMLRGEVGGSPELN